MLISIRSGGIWTNLLPPALELYLGNSTLAETAYTDPFGFAATYALGSPEREAVGRAYSEAQVCPSLTHSPSSEC